MKVGAYSTLIVAVILGVILTTSLMVPVIANVDAGQTEEKMVPVDVTNGELYDSRHNAPDGAWTTVFYGGRVWGSWNINYDRLYVDNTYIEGTYFLDGDMRDGYGGYECELYGVVGGTKVDGGAAFFISYDDASLYGISLQDYCLIECNFFVSDYSGGRLDATAIIGNSGNKEDRPTVVFTIIPQGVVAYDGKPEITPNGYNMRQVMLKSGLTTSATTEAYYITGMTPSSARVVDRVTHNNTLVGYLDENETQPVYKFNANNDIDLFAPIDNTFLGVETIEYTDYYNVKDVTIYEKKDVPVDSPIKWVLAIIPVMVLVGIVVFVINTQIVQKRD